MSFTYAKCYTAGLVAFGANGATNHYATCRHTPNTTQRITRRAAMGERWYH